LGGHKIQQKHNKYFIINYITEISVNHIYKVFSKNIKQVTPLLRLYIDNHRIPCAQTD